MFRKSKKQRDTPAPFNLLLDDQQLLEFPSDLIEGVRYMATRLMYKKAFPSRFALVSALRQEGVTFVSRSLGAVLANDYEEKVCVVELNWWWPDTSIAWLPHQPGLADVLNGNALLQDAIVTTNLPNLSIVPAGKMTRTDRPIYARSERLEEIIDELSEQYDYLLLDIPAILATNDSIPLASLASACGVIINQGVTTIENVRLSLDEIDHLNISGVVLNKVSKSTPSLILKYIPQDPSPVSSV